MHRPRSKNIASLTKADQGVIKRLWSPVPTTLTFSRFGQDREGNTPSVLINNEKIHLYCMSSYCVVKPNPRLADHFRNDFSRCTFTTLVKGNLEPRGRYVHDVYELW